MREKPRGTIAESIAAQCRESKNPDRLHSFELLRALCGSLKKTLGRSIEAFAPSPLATKEYKAGDIRYTTNGRLAIRPSDGSADSWELAPGAMPTTLTLCGDQSAVNVALASFMILHLRYAIVWFSDPAHRLWNDCRLALNRCSLWSEVVGPVKAAGDFLNGGSFSQGAWKSAIRDDLSGLARLPAGDMIRAIEPFAEQLSRDLGAPTPTADNVALFVKEIRDRWNAVRLPQVKMRRWFEWVSFAKEFRGVWGCALTQLTRRGGRGGDGARGNHRTVQRILEDGFVRNSIDVCLEALAPFWVEHGRVAVAMRDPSACRGYLVELGAGDLLSKTVARAAAVLGDERVHERLGLSLSRADCPAPETERRGQIAELLSGLIFELIGARVVSQQPWAPRVFYALLCKDAVAREIAMREIQTIWRATVYLEKHKGDCWVLAEYHAASRPISGQIPFRVMCLLCEEAKWDPADARVRAYAEALSGGFGGTVSLERVFGVLRDVEQRGQRSTAVSRARLYFSAIKASGGVAGCDPPWLSLTRDDWEAPLPPNPLCKSFFENESSNKPPSGAEDIMGPRTWPSMSDRSLFCAREALLATRCAVQQMGDSGSSSPAGLPCSFAWLCAIIPRLEVVEIQSAVSRGALFVVASSPYSVLGFKVRKVPAPPPCGAYFLFDTDVVSRVPCPAVWGATVTPTTSEVVGSNVVRAQCAPPRDVVQFLLESGVALPSDALRRIVALLDLPVPDEKREPLDARRARALAAHYQLDKDLVARNHCSSKTADVNRQRAEFVEVQSLFLFRS